MAKTEFDAIKFIATLKVWRKMNNLSAVEASQLANIAISSYSFLENGERPPKIAELSHLCEMMDFDVADFFKSPEKPKRTGF